MYFQKIFIFAVVVVISFTCQGQIETNHSKDWWKESVFYEIYMPSYKDSNDDGYSDFKGLTSKLDYIQSLGVKGIWLTPFLKSPKVDNGYDVSDYYSVDSTYGTNKDFEIFLNEAHKRNLKIIMDLVLNHTSTDSKWFQESKKSKENPYRDYYIWRDKPNNWESFFGGSAWEFNSISNQYYYHKFDKRMADLNWQNPKVVEDIQKIIHFWCEMGVDGFRLDVINFLTTNGVTKDNPIKNGKQIHLYDKDQAGIKNAMKIIKSTINEYPNKFVIGEIGSDDINVLKKYQSPYLLDVVFNFNFGSIIKFSAKNIFHQLKSMEKNMNNYPTLFFGSHDMPRIMNRLADNNSERAVALAALILTAKGVPFIYYGEEIGMQNINADSVDEMRDIQGIINYNLSIKEGKSKEEALKIGNEHNRDKSRSPMQWNTEKYAGFSEVEPWINVNSDYLSVNVENYENQKSSILNRYRQLIKLRNSEPVLQYGIYSKLKFNKNCISFSRIYNGIQVKCFFNFDEKPIIIKLDNNEKVLVGKTLIEPNNFLIVQKEAF